MADDERERLGYELESQRAHTLPHGFEFHNTRSLVEEAGTLKRQDIKMRAGIMVVKACCTDVRLPPVAAGQPGRICRPPLAARTSSLGEKPLR